MGDVNWRGDARRSPLSLRHVPRGQHAHTKKEELPSPWRRESVERDSQGSRFLSRRPLFGRKPSRAANGLLDRAWHANECGTSGAQHSALWARWPATSLRSRNTSARRASQHVTGGRGVCLCMRLYRTLNMVSVFRGATRVESVGDFKSWSHSQTELHAMQERLAAPGHLLKGPDLYFTSLRLRKSFFSSSRLHLASHI